MGECHSIVAAEDGKKSQGDCSRGKYEHKLTQISRKFSKVYDNVEIKSNIVFLIYTKVDFFTLRQFNCRRLYFFTREKIKCYWRIDLRLT